MRDGVATFGELLRDFRLRAGLSQSDLAERANISESAVGALERGARKAPYRNTVNLLAKALQLDQRESEALQAARTAARSTPVAVAHNLRTDRTSFVGREDDVDQIVKLLRRSRLISVTGSGGVGKTRVALEVARHVIGDMFPEVWFVDLGPLIDADFIVAKLANSIRPPIGDRVDTIADVASAFGKRPMLLIFDNCEHLLERAAQAADAIVEACPRVSILATSRERLNVAGESAYRLPSLTHEPAIELFVQRATETDPGLSLGAKTLPAVTDIVRQLGGIPLAIELTAALVPQLGLDVLRSQLREYLSVRSGHPALPARQQTVMATIEWSYNLLTPKERKLLCEVSVFTGGFTLAGAEAVCGDDALDRAYVLPLLSSLANKSLVTALNIADRTRYELLEPVRAFGIEQLRDGAALDSVVRRHAQWFAAIADDVEDSVSTLLPDRTAELVPEFDNVRAAVSWSLQAPDRDDVAFAGRILCGFYGLWDHLGRPREHRAWIEAALERIDENRYPVVTAYLLRDFMTRTQAQFVALEPIDRAVRIAEQSGDEIALIKVLNVVCQVQAVHGQLAEAERSGRRAYELVIANGLQRTHHYCENLLSRSFICFMQRKIDEARQLVASAEETALSIGLRYTVIRHYQIRRAEIEFVAGHTQAALAFVQSMIDSEFGDEPAVRTLALPRIAVLHLLADNAAGAVPALRELIRLLRDGYGNSTYFELEYAALALALLGRTSVSAKLYGALRSREQDAKFRRLPMRQAAWDLLRSTLRAQLGEDAFDRLGGPDDALLPEEMITEALAALGE